MYHCHWQLEAGLATDTGGADWGIGRALVPARISGIKRVPFQAVTLAVASRFELVTGTTGGADGAAKWSRLQVLGIEKPTVK